MYLMWKLWRNFMGLYNFTEQQGGSVKFFMCYGDKAFFKCLELYSNKNAIKHWDKQIIDELKYFQFAIYKPE